MADINVFMVGGRRTGKTSILAAMDGCCDDVLSKVDGLQITASPDAGIELSHKLAELKRYFTAEEYLKQFSFSPDVNPNSGGVAEFLYDIDINDRDTGYTMRFLDRRGEDFKDFSIEADVQKMVNESQVIMITIDTPSLVEQPEKATGIGINHKRINLCNEITRFLKTAFQNCSEEKLVLFVPLKCEKYYYNGTLKKVNDCVKKGYAELYDFLIKSDVKDLCTVAIVPILTVGGLQFLKFDDNSYVGQYYYVENHKEYKPKYCETPLFLTLLYLIHMAERNKNEMWKITRWFEETFKNKAKLKDLISCKSILENVININEESGFEMLNDAIGMFTK